MKFDFPWDPALVLHKTYGLKGFFVTLVKGWAPFWWVYLNGIGSFGGTGVICLYFFMVVCLLDVRNQGFGAPVTSKTHPPETPRYTENGHGAGCTTIGNWRTWFGTGGFRMELFGPKGWSHRASNQVIKRAPTSRVRTQMSHVSSGGPPDLPLLLNGLLSIGKPL